MLRLIAFAAVIWAGCSGLVEPHNAGPVLNSKLQLIWQDSTADRGRAFSISHLSPIVDDGRMYVAYDSVVQCILLDSGQVLWTSSILGPNHFRSDAQPISQEMILDGSRLAIVAENYILCVSTEDGSKLWDWVAPKGEYPARLFNHYSQSAEAIYVSLDYYPGAVVKLAKSDGHEIWKTRNTMILDDIYKGVDFSDVHSGAVYYDGRVYIGSRYGASRIGNGVYKDGSMTCLDDATGQILWMKQVPRLDTNMNGHSYTPSE